MYSALIVWLPPHFPYSLVFSPPSFSSRLVPSRSFSHPLHPSPISRIKSERFLGRAPVNFDIELPYTLSNVSHRLQSLRRASRIRTCSLFSLISITCPNSYTIPTLNVCLMFDVGLHIQSVIFRCPLRIYNDNDSHVLLTAATHIIPYHSLNHRCCLFRCLTMTSPHIAVSSPTGSMCCPRTRSTLDRLSAKFVPSSYYLSNR